MKIYLEQSQKQILSQKMIQSVNILQMGSQALGEYINELYLENPALEITEEIPESKEEERLKKIEWLASLDEQNRFYYQYDNSSSEYDYFNNFSVSQTETLRDILRQQLLGKGYSREDMDIFEYIIESLDANGYFTESLEEVEILLHKKKDKLRHCLEVMKTLEPAGVCASSLKECLLIQLNKKGNYYNEIMIVKNYLELLSKRQLPVIAKKMKLSLEEVKDAVEHIKELNPRPAQGFDDKDFMHYITPDITIVKLKNHLEILLNNYSYPVISVNRDYIQMLQNGCDKELKKYLTDKINQVNQMKDAIEKRGSTLMELSKCLVKVQEKFFLYGPQYICPFMMKEAAQILNVHESTISRAVKGKYLHCCWGTFPFSYFFSRAVPLYDIGTFNVASIQVKQWIKEQIEKENKKRPYSDQQLSEMIKTEGVELSRRTIVKYRESMGIANSRNRREF